MSNLPARHQSTAVAVSQLLPPAAGEKSLADRLEGRRQTISPGLYCFRPGEGPNAEERRAAEAWVAEVVQRLNDTIPADGGQIVEEVSEQVYASFKTRDAKTTDQQIYDGYLIALPERSAPAVREALRRIMRDEAPKEYSRVFVPTPGELAMLARTIEAEWRLEATRLAKALVMPEAQLTFEGRPASPADAQRIEAFQAKLAGAMKPMHGGASR